jgi:hypothetical protein
MNNACNVALTNVAMTILSRLIVTSTLGFLPPIPSTAGAFGTVDLLLQLTARPLIARLLRNQGAAAGATVSQKLVTKALIIIVSFVHLAVQVDAAALLKGGQSAPCQISSPSQLYPLKPLPVTDMVQCRLQGNLEFAAATGNDPLIPVHPLQIPVGLAVLLDPRLAADPVYGVSAMSLAMVTISSGYFTYDLVTVLLRFDVEGAQFLLHALCCLFVYGYAVFFGTLHWFGERPGSTGCRVCDGGGRCTRHGKQADACVRSAMQCQTCVLVRAQTS